MNGFAQLASINFEIEVEPEFCIRTASAMASSSPQQPRALQRDAEAAVEACTTGDVGVLRALLASNGGAIVEWRDGDGLTVLASACYSPHAQKQVAMVELLLSSRADPNVADHEGNTPLMLAVNEGRAGVLRLLLRHGADTEARATGGPFEGCTALEIARQQLAERDACVQLLSSWRVGEEPPPASRPPSALARARGAATPRAPPARFSLTFGRGVGGVAVLAVCVAAVWWSRRRHVK